MLMTAALSPGHPPGEFGNWLRQQSRYRLLRDVGGGQQSELRTCCVACEPR